VAPADESVRIEVAFEGGQIIGAVVASETADAVEHELATGSQAALQVDTDDARVTIMLSQVVYLKRYARDAAVGFGL
jgi:hypothetical protein